MTWDELAKHAYDDVETGMCNLYPCAFVPGDEFEMLPTEQQAIWRDLVRTIYNLAEEDARGMIVQSLCQGGL